MILWKILYCIVAGNAVKGGAQAVGKALATGADTLGKAATGTINFVGGLLGKLG
jgi:hypothetical protein